MSAGGDFHRAAAARPFRPCDRLRVRGELAAAMVRGPVAAGVCGVDLGAHRGRCVGGDGTAVAQRRSVTHNLLSALSVAVSRIALSVAARIASMIGDSSGSKVA